VIATNGIAAQTTVAVITAKPVVGFVHQSLFKKSPKWSLVSVQLRTPNS
jgi:hypothetical protein